MNKMSEVVAINKFNESLIKLSNAIGNIFRVQTIDITTWMKIYTLIYEHCTSSSSVLAESNLFRTATGRQKHLLSATLVDGSRPSGGVLYCTIENYLINYVENFCQLSDNMSDEDLLRFYVDQWNNYQSSSHVLHHTFCYLHRHWLPRAHANGFTSIYEIFTLSMLIWQEIFLKPISNRLTDICLNMIETERNTQVFMNTHLIKDVINSYMNFNFNNEMSLWFNGEQTMIAAVNVYKEWFEEPFLEKTKRFYRIEADKHVNDSLIEYLTKVARYLNEEEHRAHSYLRLSSTSSFLTMIEEILIHHHLNAICDEVRTILSKKDYEDLKCLFELIKQMPITKTKLKIIIKDHIYQIGHQSIEEISPIAIHDPKIYVKTIVEIYEKFSVFIQEVFLNDSIFVDAFNQACSKFINNNAVTQTAGSTTKSPELLARYCDTLLRKRNKAVEETDLEEEFNQIMIVFNYIEDKDVYLKFYEKMLAKRLIGQLSASDEDEESMISKLKQTCGFEYTSKLQRMFQDIGVSKTLIVEYEKYCENQQVIGVVDFSVMVLSSNSWPFSASSNFVFPIELKSTFDSFTEFYTHHHNGRKLTWLHQHSKGELQTFFTPQKYILQVSTYQMVVLLLFNKVLTWTVERIQDETQIKSELLSQVIFGLLKSKLLLCTDINENDLKDSDIKMNYSIRLATDFKSKKLRINLNVPLKSVEQKDIEGVHRTIDEDRKMVIQAVIVRIMKARQTLKHSLLMQEVIQQLSSRFRPKIPVIKKCIDTLIEKEYFERQSNEKDVLRYLA